MYKKFSYSQADISRMPKRFKESHKGSYGRLLLIAGSTGMCGAAYLAAKAAYRMGVGLVHIFTAEENLVPLQVLIPEAIFTSYKSESPDLGALSDCIDKADAVVIGCGLGRSAGAKRIVSFVFRKCNKPTVVDADALNIASESEVLRAYLSGKIITPHVGEASRLMGVDTNFINESREATVVNMAKKLRTFSVLKGSGTLVYDGGELMYENTSGNNGMSTAGSGDVLAGMIGAILASGANDGVGLFESAALGVYIHGLAGDDAAERLSEYSVMASDIIESIPIVLKRK